MATTLINAAIKPAATTLTTLYTCPSNTQMVSSSILVCNLSATATTFRIARRLLGSSIDDSHYIAYDQSIQANDTAEFTTGITFKATDVLSVYSDSGNVTFNLSGQENT